MWSNGASLARGTVLALGLTFAGQGCATAPEPDASRTSSNSDSLINSTTSVTESEVTLEEKVPDTKASPDRLTDPAESDSNVTAELNAELEAELEAQKLEQEQQRWFFAHDHLPIFEITLNDQSWDGLANTVKGEFEYWPADISYDGEIYPNVGIRLKGQGSYLPLDEKPALKIKLDKYVDDQALHGLEGLTFNNLVQDASGVHERLAYYLYREAGIAAPRANNAEVYINGEYYGLYANVESVDEGFVRRSFEPGDDGQIGNLYDTAYDYTLTDLDRSIEREQSGAMQEQRFELETNKKDEDLSSLTAAIDGNFNSDVADGWWAQPLYQVIDVDQFLRHAAVDAVLAHWDGYFGGKNNYQLYQDVANGGQLKMVPWGLDQTFGFRKSAYVHLDYCLNTENSRMDKSLFMLRCEREPECMAAYEQQIVEVLELWHNLPLEQRLDEAQEQIADSVRFDRHRPYKLGKHVDVISNTRLYFTERPPMVEVQFDQILEDCELDPLP